MSLDVTPNPNSFSRLLLILLDPKSFQTALDFHHMGGCDGIVVNPSPTTLVMHCLFPAVKVVGSNPAPPIQ